HRKVRRGLQGTDQRRRPAEHQTRAVAAGIDQVAVQGAQDAVTPWPGQAERDRRCGASVIAMSPLASSHPFRAAAEAGDIEALVATLAPDVVLHSPVTFHPYLGRETVGGVLGFVSQAFSGWR